MVQSILWCEYRESPKIKSRTVRKVVCRALEHGKMQMPLIKMDRNQFHTHAHFQRS